MKIRNMTIGDYLSVKKIWDECDISDEPEDCEEEIGSLLKSPQSNGFVAYENGTIVGAILCGNDGRYGYIHHLAVTPKKRKLGVGRSLVEECIRFLKKRHVIIMVRKDNISGNKFWDHLRFQDADWIKVQFISTV